MLHGIFRPSSERPREAGGPREITLWDETLNNARAAGTGITVPLPWQYGNFLEFAAYFINVFSNGNGQVRILVRDAKNTAIATWTDANSTADGSNHSGKVTIVPPGNIVTATGGMWTLWGATANNAADTGVAGGVCAVFGVTGNSINPAKDFSIIMNSNAWVSGSRVVVLGKVL